MHSTFVGVVPQRETDATGCRFMLAADAEISLHDKYRFMIIPYKWPSGFRFVPLMWSTTTSPSSEQFII
jgi:hypothetical protein